jgi:gamma-glutamyltranspeptidase/glutathione hydrolase
MQGFLAFLNSLVPISSWLLSQPQSLPDILKNNPYHSHPRFGSRHHDKLGAVASENRVCSQIGIDILRAGGNAADALVGTVFCIGVVDCHHSGLGGGGFALARSDNGSYESIDFREAAPGAASEDMYDDNILGSIFGGLAR